MDLIQHPLLLISNKHIAYSSGRKKSYMKILVLPSLWQFPDHIHKIYHWSVTLI